MGDSEILNKKVPNFNLMMTNESNPFFAELQGKKVVLFFYPKDATPICTSEAKAFRDHFSQFQQANTLVFGISRDNVISHERFKAKLALPFELIADTDEVLCNYFNVIAQKNFFGKQIRGIVRSTFLLDENNIVRYAWRKIKVTGHIQQVLNAVQELE